MRNVLSSPLALSPPVSLRRPVAAPPAQPQPLPPSPGLPRASSPRRQRCPGAHRGQERLLEHSGRGSGPGINFQTSVIGVGRGAGVGAWRAPCFAAGFVRGVGREGGGLPAACAAPLWVFKRNLSNVFQELLAEHGLIICFKR